MCATHSQLQLAKISGFRLWIIPESSFPSTEGSRALVRDWAIINYSAHIEHTVSNRDWGAQRLKTNVLTFVYIFDTCAEATLI